MEWLGVPSVVMKCRFLEVPFTRDAKLGMMPANISSYTISRVLKNVAGDGRTRPNERAKKRSYWASVARRPRILGP